MLLQGYELILITFEYFWDFKVLFVLLNRKKKVNGRKEKY